MPTLKDAFKHIESNLTPEYLQAENLKGEDLVRRVLFLNRHFLNIRKAIHIYGSDFEIPFSDDQIPSNNSELFVGCVNWQPLSNQYVEK